MSNRISNKYYFYIGILMIITNMFYPRSMLPARENFFLSLVLGISLNIVMLFIYKAILKGAKGQGIFENVRRVFGEKTGNLGIYLLTLLPFGVATLNINGLLKVIRLQMDGGVYPYLCVFIVVAVSCFLAFGGIHEYSRFSGVCFFAVLMVLALCFYMAVGNINFQNFYAFESDGDLFFDAIEFALSPLGELFILVCIVSGGKVNFKGLLSTSVVGTLLICAGITLGMLVFQGTAYEKLSFPFYNTLSVIGGTKVVSRIDSIGIFAYIASTVVKTAACIFFAKKAFEISCAKRKSNVYTCLFATLLFLFGIFTKGEGEKLFYPVLISTQVVIPLFLLVGMKIKGYCKE